MRRMRIIMQDMRRNTIAPYNYCGLRATRITLAAPGVLRHCGCIPAAFATATYRA